MTRLTQTLPAATGSTEITRFNALRHGILSRYTVLPWEDAEEYRTIVAALVAEHAPQGPTEEHLRPKSGRPLSLNWRTAAVHHRCLHISIGIGVRHDARTNRADKSRAIFGAVPHKCGRSPANLS
jgi:hypothetical protein